MVLITRSREVNASSDHIWEIISDVDRDTEYWSGLASIQNVRNDENVIERQVVVGFMGRKVMQRIELVPKESIHLTMTDGPLLGSRVIKLTRLEAKRTKIDVSWDIQFSQIPAFAQGFVRARLDESTREALDRIAKTAESR